MTLKKITEKLRRIQHIQSVLEVESFSFCWSASNRTLFHVPSTDPLNHEILGVLQKELMSLAQELGLPTEILPGGRLRII